MLTAFFMASFMLGFAGSLHCAGMCGPLVLAMPFHSFGPDRKTAAIFLYNSGRILAYAFLGLCTGLFGAGVNWLSLSQILSITLGVLVMLSVLLPRVYPAVSLPGRNPLKHLQRSLFRSFMTKQKLYQAFGCGVMNGLLPCGLVYVALAASVLTGSVAYAMFFMLNFGLGTLPLLLLIAVWGQPLLLRKKNLLRRLSPWITLLVGVLLLLRGLYPAMGHMHERMNTQWQHKAIECMVP